ncbi:MAG TPA: hypothetical protein VK917_05690, partial [Ilumatobacter sp.]|nr:hypothetical protein [Ilumatobacter sp.]
MSLTTAAVGVASTRTDAPNAGNSLAGADPGERLTTLLGDLDDAIDVLRADAYLSATLDAAAAAPEASIAQALELVEELDVEELAEVGAALESAPAIERIPEAIET